MNGATFLLGNVSSASRRFDEEHFNQAAGGCATVAAAGGAAFCLATDASVGKWVAVMGAALALGLAMAAGGARRHALVLMTSGGEQVPLHHQDAAFVDRVARAVGDAIVARG